MITDTTDLIRLSGESAAIPPPRAVCASTMAEASSAMVGKKRSMGEKTVAISCLGKPMRKIAALDRIVVLEEGAVVEDGTHQELSRAGGTYESLWDRQTGAFLEAE